MTPSNDHPEIPSLKPVGKEEEKKGGGLAPSSAAKPASSGFKFPGFGGTGGAKGVSAPGLRVRGLSNASTVMDRLKNLRKKDLIFIAAGLCTLGMAPLAEQLLMSPEEASGVLKEGFSTQGPLFADGSTVYEQGSGVGSPGGLVGQGTDVITPLNVRDPSNLVMSPGATKKTDAVVAPPPTTAGGKTEPDWKDVLKDSARSGASKAVQQTPKLPRPNVKMAGAIRGLSALGGGGGGTSASLKLDGLRAEHAPNHAGGSNSLTRSQATPGFRGATSRSNSSTGAGEDLKNAGSRQADIFNRGGGAANALDSASREGIPTGGAGFGNGRPGNGDETKNPGGNNAKSEKQLGESLAFLRQKMEQDKQIDLKWKKKEWKEFGRQKMMEESAIKMGFDMFGKFAEKAVLDPLADAISQMANPGPNPSYNCTLNSGEKISGTKGALAKMGFTLKAGGMLWSTGDSGRVEGRCTAVGEGPGTGGPEDPYADPKNPDKLPGAPRSTIADTAGKDIQKLVAGCAAQQGGKTFCERVAVINRAVGGVMVQAETANNSSLDFLGQAYGKMKTEHTEINTGVTGFGSLVGAKDDTAAPFAVVASKGKSALNAANATDQEKRLTEAKEEGHNKAIGEGDGKCATAAGALTAPCNQISASLTAKTAVETELTQARDQYVEAVKQAKATREIVVKAAETIPASGTDPAGVSLDTDNASLSGASHEVLGRLKALDDTITKTGTFNDKADAVLKGGKDSLDSWRDGVFSGAAATASHSLTPTDNLQAVIEKTGASSKALVDAPAKKCAASSESYCWRHAGTLGDDAKPVGDKAAGVHNRDIGNLHSYVPPVQENVEAARASVQARTTEGGTLKTKIDTCARDFSCGNPAP